MLCAGRRRTLPNLTASSRRQFGKVLLSTSSKRSFIALPVAPGGQPMGSIPRRMPFITQFCWVRWRQVGRNRLHAALMTCFKFAGLISALKSRSSSNANFQPSSPRSPEVRKPPGQSGGCQRQTRSTRAQAGARRRLLPRCQCMCIQSQTAQRRRSD